MSEEMEAAIRRLCHLPGYGCRNAPLWICGIEEHGGGAAPLDWQTLQEFAAQIPEECWLPTRGPGDANSRTIQRSYQLAAFAHKLPVEHNFFDSWLKQPDLLLLINLRPPYRPRLREQFLNIGEADYRKPVEQVRFPFLRQKRNERARKPIVVCHGKSEWSSFRKVFVGKEISRFRSNVNKPISRFMASHG